MILIGEILVADEVVKKHFACNLEACKGACCVEGDYGAPLTEDEILTIGQILNEVMPYLPEKSRQVIRDKGFSTYNDEADTQETELMPDGSCVFMGREANGITFCGIEKAYYDGEVEFKKPISCHLYPIRVSKNKQTGFQALNYDKWDICNAACTRGDKEQIKIYEFAKDALIRAYGEDFYKELEAAAEEVNSK